MIRSGLVGRKRGRTGARGGALLDEPALEHRAIGTLGTIGVFFFIPKNSLSQGYDLQR